jgi:hypothetical protein
MPPPWFVGLDDTGVPLSGGLLDCFVAGTSTRQTTYADSALLVPNTNPVVLDSAGRATVYLAAASYKFVLKTAAGVIVRTQDNIGSVTLGNISTDVISPPALSASVNDYTPTGLSTARNLRLASTASWQITGIAAQTAGTLLTLWNGGAQDIVLVTASAASVAANRFQCPRGVNLTINSGSSAMMWYDGVSSLWRVLGV